MSERLNAFSVKTCCGDKDTIDWVDYDLDCINVLCIMYYSRYSSIFVFFVLVFKYYSYLVPGNTYYLILYYYCITDFYYCIF